MLCIFAGPTPLRQGMSIPDGVVGEGGVVKACTVWWEPAEEGAIDLWGRPVRMRRRMRLLTRLSGGPFSDAGVMQRRVESEVGPLEHRRFVQETREGMFLLRGRYETDEERMIRLVGPYVAKALRVMGYDPFRDEVRGWLLQGIRYRIPHEQVYISPSLSRIDDGRPITREDFPPNWCFGNGVTANANVVPLRDGSYRVLSWCVTPHREEAMWRDWGRLEALRQVVEQ